jgi:hypothetical protein
VSAALSAGEPLSLIDQIVREGPEVAEQGHPLGARIMKSCNITVNVERHCCAKAHAGLTANLCRN